MRIICLAFVPWFLVQVNQDSCAGCGPGEITTISTDSDGDGRTAQDGDCDDGDPYTYEGAPELCDDADNDCNDVIDDVGLQTWFHDGDGDTYGASVTAQLQSGCDVPGWVLHDYDCDDSNPNINPAAKEACDGFDNDCNSNADDVDADLDGYSTCGNEDCNDAVITIHPGAEEICNRLDDDCDGLIDEGVVLDLYLDEDGDGYGNPGGVVNGCVPSEGNVANAADCDDLDPMANPEEDERCGTGSAMGDDDCDGIPDEDCATSYFYCKEILRQNNDTTNEVDTICRVDVDPDYHITMTAPAEDPLLQISIPTPGKIKEDVYICQIYDDAGVAFQYDLIDSRIPPEWRIMWDDCNADVDVFIQWVVFRTDPYIYYNAWAILSIDGSTFEVQYDIAHWWPSAEMKISAEVPATNWNHLNIKHF